MFSGHDWRTAIGPRAGYFERCRNCYATRPIQDQPEVPNPERSTTAAPAKAGERSEQQRRSDERAA